MAQLAISFVINRPVEEVFAFLSNNENSSKWLSGVIAVKKTSEGPIGVGTTWRVVRTFLGRRMEEEAECTEYEPNRRFATKGKAGPIPAKAQTTFESVEGGTRVDVEFELGGFFKLVEPLLVKMLKRQAEADLPTLKELMEAHALHQQGS